MALKPTIYKFNISISDFNHDYYDSVSLTIALHPSETHERMMARVLAFCFNLYKDSASLMTFTKGLSAIEEPDIWIKELDDQISLWVDVGEPSFDRIKKSCRLAKQSYVYSFNSKSAVWWKQIQPQFQTLPVTVVSFDWDKIQNISKKLSRTMELSISINDESAFVATKDTQDEVTWHVLQDYSNN
ncbi:YaeQ family protein [uncultured Paraglaciecola sp.]|uniref:YaeQ family protein n=1 Tax=uncultured Paraglaciecola sp. TaxID=1765024 RepID=UPI00259AAF3B|nr:YaeQ family protein [uncultured Paraglaciecola sp.]